MGHPLRLMWTTQALVFSHNIVYNEKGVEVHLGHQILGR